MKVIPSKYIHGSSTEYYVVDVSEPTKIDFTKQVEDLIISSPDGDILIGWDYGRDEDFTRDNSLLVKVKDNMKEIDHERSTHFYMMPYEEGKTLKVYITVQR